MEEAIIGKASMIIHLHIYVQCDRCGDRGGWRSRAAGGNGILRARKDRLVNIIIKNCSPVCIYMYIVLIG